MSKEEEKIKATEHDLRVREENKKYASYIILGVSLISLVLLVFYFNGYFKGNTKNNDESGVGESLTEEQLLEERPEKPKYSYTDTDMYTALFYLTEDIRYTYDGLYRMTNLSKDHWSSLDYDLNSLMEEIKVLRGNLEIVANTYTDIDTSLLISLDNCLHSLSATIEGYEAGADMTSINFTLSKSMSYLVQVTSIVTTFIDTEDMEED